MSRQHICHTVKTNAGVYIILQSRTDFVAVSPDERRYTTDRQLDAEIWCWLDARQMTDR